MEYIQSPKNSRVKEWKKLLSKKDRDLTGRYIIEGEHLIEEALKTDDVMELMLQENNEVPDLWLFKDIPPVTKITADISKVISATKTPQGVFAVCRKSDSTIDLKKHKRFLLLDGVQDPGNIGTMIRTADAAGIDVVIMGEGSGDVYNPKVIRSAQGSHFHVPIIIGNLHTWIETFKASHVPVYGTALEGAVSYKEVRPTDSYALIVGNEGAGVDSTILQNTDQNLYIPIYGNSESLNVAVAAGILLYHLRK
ncbi:TrmH family RNA methyltransferase [Lederbergia panacisoli]|uniref:TrmH family RNA methyltransferase n=1 Tax=Lederbergia panacisoli TaxID=1255251 RepID=UPI00214D0B86|nr:RNA methyltransferase [Lederbergia panacisoli]MCR2821931.1 RNA methyltransferase [Lederbergia panacisoli]